MPTIEAARPITAASTTTELSTWRRDAPSVRSSANSRERWATVTANVLKIRKPPTSTATPAKTSRAILMKPSESLMSDALCSACSSPVSTSAVPPSDRLMAALSCSRRGAVVGRRDHVRDAGLARGRCAAPRSAAS